jgi:hypothetical protein
MFELSGQRSDVSLRVAIDQLPAAELDFAHFNAQRTTTTADTAGIVRGATAQFAFLLDAGRPTSSYYNRAVARAADAISAAALDDLLAAIVAIETGPAALTPDAAKLLLAHGFAPQYQLCYLAAAPASAPSASTSSGRVRHRRSAERIQHNAAPCRRAQSHHPVEPSPPAIALIVSNSWA